MEIEIECICCQECFDPDEIKYSTEVIPEFKTIEEMENFANESGVRFDCPECEEPMYLSDCSLF